MATPYARIITPLAPGYDPRHIEAYIRVAHSTLDHLSVKDFAQEVEIAMMCVIQGGEAQAEATAQSFGL